MSSDSLVINLLVLAVSGLTAGVGGLVLRKIDGVARTVAEIGKQVQEHGEWLAGGREKFTHLEKRLGELEGEVRQILMQGCAHRRACNGDE